MDEVWLTVINGVVVNRTIGKDLTAELSVKAPDVDPPVQLGWTTSDGGLTFQAPQ